MKCRVWTSLLALSLVIFAACGSGGKASEDAAPADAPPVDGPSPIPDAMPDAMPPPECSIRGYGTLASVPVNDVRFPVAVDLNNDGKLDIVAAAFDHIVTMLGNGNLRFGAQRSIAGAGELLVVRDFNNDGKLDAATYARFPTRIEIHFGNGDGTFSPTPTTTSLAQEIERLHAADLDGDGNQDLVHYYSLGAFEVAFGKGDGTFESPLTIAVIGYPWDATIADVNEDGRRDLVVGTNAGVNVITLQANRVFSSAQLLGPGDYAQDVETADINGDGHLDILVAATFEAHIFWGGGDGSFGPRAYFYSPRPGMMTTAMVVGDINHDQHPDLVVSDGASIVSLINQGDGTFERVSQVAGTMSPLTTQLADMDNDGQQDLFGVRDGIQILRGEAQGGFVTRAAYAPSLKSPSLTLADVNNDGRLDVVVGQSTANDVSVFIAEADGSLRSPTKIFGAGSPLIVRAGDFNADGKVDLAFSYHAGQRIGFVYGNGDGSFSARQDIETGHYQPITLEVADINGDGRDDIVTAGDVRNISVLLATPTGFAPFIENQTEFGVTSLALVDITGDGKVDVLSTEYSNHSFSVNPGVGDGTLLAPTRYVSTNSINRIHVADLDGDGIRDVIVGNIDIYGKTALQINKGLAGGTFAAGTLIPILDTLNEIEVTDLNNDGKLDLIVMRNYVESISLYYGQGNLDFSAPVTYPAGLNPSAAAATDLNGDGRKDIVVANMNSDFASVEVLLDKCVR